MSYPRRGPAARDVARFVGLAFLGFFSERERRNQPEATSPEDGRLP
jgi:hypothetical protein